jgi:hypothetical protein
MDLFLEIDRLHLPSGQYIVVGSGIMSAKGIRSVNDLDIVVTPTVFEEFKNVEGWDLLPWTKEGVDGKEWLRNGEVELYEQLSQKEGSLSVEELLRDSEIINGIPFITLEKLIEFKRAYGRPKDFEDIRIIEEHLASAIN